jgi:hypothetical protein
MDRTRDVFETAFSSSLSSGALDRSVEAMTAVGAYHADQLRRERFQIQKRHARNLVRRLISRDHGTFDWSWFRSESAQNDRTIRIVERWFLRYFGRLL